MEQSILWLDTHIRLRTEQAVLEVKEQLQKEELLASCGELPYTQLEPGTFAHLEESFQSMLSHLDELCKVNSSLRYSFPDTWREQHKKIQRWNTILLGSKKVFLEYEQCLLELDSLALSVQENWMLCPPVLLKQISATDGIDVLQQIRLDLLMQQEEDDDDENPNRNPYFAAQIRHNAKQEYLGIYLSLPPISDQHSLYKAEEELAFQVEWLSKIPLMLQQCTQKEVEELSPPDIPFERAEVYSFLERYRCLQENRKSLLIRVFQKKYHIDPDLLSVHNVAARIANGQPFVEMVQVEAGRYRLESLGGKPHHQKKPFWISIVPVTEGLFDFFHRKTRDVYKASFLPKTGISWFQALHFCNFLSQLDGLEPCYRLGINLDAVQYNPSANGYRLPTEQEWEVAAQSRWYPQIQKRKEYMWCVENTNTLQNVATRKPNQLCLYDMLGNVWEWCFDRYILEDEQKTVSNYCVVRGGSFNSSLHDISFALREGRIVERGFRDVGFRFVRNGETQVL